MLLVYRCIPILLLLVVSFNIHERRADASARYSDGCKLYPSGAAEYPHYAEGCCFFSIRARGLAQPVERYTPALVVCLYPAMFSMKKRKNLGLET